jgi:hypothetical protein
MNNKTIPNVEAGATNQVAQEDVARMQAQAEILRKTKDVSQKTHAQLVLLLTSSF